MERNTALAVAVAGIVGLGLAAVLAWTSLPSPSAPVQADVDVEASADPASSDRAPAAAPAPAAPTAALDDPGRGAPGTAQPVDRSPPREPLDPRLEAIEPELHQVLADPIDIERLLTEVPPDEAAEVFDEMVQELNDDVDALVRRYEDVAQGAPDGVAADALDRAGLLYADLARKIREVPPPAGLPPKAAMSWDEGTHQRAMRFEQRAMGYHDKAERIR